MSCQTKIVFLCFVTGLCDELSNKDSVFLCFVTGLPVWWAVQQWFCFSWFCYWAACVMSCPTVILFFFVLFLGCLCDEVSNNDSVFLCFVSGLPVWWGVQQWLFFFVLLVGCLCDELSNNDSVFLCFVTGLCDELSNHDSGTYNNEISYVFLY